MFRRILRLFNERIQWRLTTYMVLLVLAAILIVVAQIFPAWRNEITDNINVGEESFVQSKQVQLQAFVDNLDEDIRFLGRLDSVNRLAIVLNDPNATEEDISLARQAVEQDFFVFSDARRIYDQVRFIDVSGDEIVRIDFDGDSTISIRDVDRLAFKGDRGYFLGTIAQAQGEVYVSRLDLNREGTPPTIEGSIDNGTAVPVIRYGIPVYTLDDNLEPVLSGTVITNVYAQFLLDLVVPNTADANSFLIDQDGYYLVNSRDPLSIFGFEPGIEDAGGTAEARIQNDYEETAFSKFFINVPFDKVETSDNFVVHFSRVSPPSADFFWVVGNVRDEASLFEQLNDATISTAITVLSVLFVVVIAGILVIGRFTSPLVDLAKTAHGIAEGDLTSRAVHTARPDEIGELSQAFNTMTDQLKDTVDGLEQRIDIATRDLQALVDVNIQTATILNPERLLEAVANLAKNRFDLYHAHIYILEDQKLVLRAGAGYVGRQMIARGHTIALDSPRSIVAKAALARELLLENDTAASENFLPNALLPDTAAEISIPLIARGQLLGVLDLQSDEINHFDNRNIAILEVLAAQLANAISNAQLYEETSRTSRHEQALSHIVGSMQQASTIDDILQTAVKELGKALRVPHTAIEVELKDNLNPSNNNNV